KRQRSARYALDLTSGSLLVMEGRSQIDFRHALPKSATVTEARVNLTFRYMAASNAGRPSLPLPTVPPARVVPPLRPAEVVEFVVFGKTRRPFSEIEPVKDVAPIARVAPETKIAASLHPVSVTPGAASGSGELAAR